MIPKRHHERMASDGGHCQCDYFWSFLLAGWLTRVTIHSDMRDWNGAAGCAINNAEHVWFFNTHEHHKKTRKNSIRKQMQNS